MCIKLRSLTLALKLSDRAPKSLYTQPNTRLHAKGYTVKLYKEIKLQKKALRRLEISLNDYKALGYNQWVLDLEGFINNASSTIKACESDLARAKREGNA